MPPKFFVYFFVVANELYFCARLCVCETAHVCAAACVVWAQFYRMYAYSWLAFGGRSVTDYWRLIQLNGMYDKVFL